MKIIKPVYIIAGFLCAVIGTAGVFLPVLPGTPFFLLAAFCFAKGSARFHRWFVNTKLYRKHLENFAVNRSMRIKTKLGILIPVTVMLILTAVMIKIPAVRIVIIALLLVKYWYFIFIIKTVKPCKTGLHPQGLR
jgi:uncharacterized membrane protein YbaN (DUF454 family)